jgi:lipopolysaccharide transport system permease protein
LSRLEAANAANLRNIWTIAPRREGLLLRLQEFVRYRKILWFFMARTLKRTYEGTVLGKVWLLRPVIPIAIGAFVFGRFLAIPSDGVPYFLFFLAGSAIWMLFEQSALWVTRSLDLNKGLITKVYFPRLVIPVSAIAPATVYFAVFLVLLAIAFIRYRFSDGQWYFVSSPWVAAAPVAALLCSIQALAIGLWTSVWQTKFREVRYTLRFVLQLWNYLTPVIYPLSMVPVEYQPFMLLNPMAAYVEMFKFAVLGVGTFDAISLGTAVTITLVSLICGAWYFTREESRAIDNL